MKVLLLPLYLFTSASLLAVTDDESDILLSASVNSTFNAVVTYSYDNAGNITRKVYERVLTGTELMEKSSKSEQRSMIDDLGISVKADRTWEHVTVSTSGHVDGQCVSMSVCSLSGMSCFSSELSGNHMQIDLSGLARGVYLFRFTINGENKSYKLIKR